MPLNKCGLPRYHFRRIGPLASLPEVKDVMDFTVKTTLIGRNRGQMTYYISSKREENRKYISRSHARVVRSASNQHKLIDSSMNGMFVNDVKIEGPTILEEGDTVTFGHPNGQNLPPATRVRQPDSEYQFVFELCDCSDGNQSNDNSPQQLPMVARNQSCCSNSNAVFQVPAAVPLRKPNRDASPLVHIEEIKPQSRDCPAAGSNSCQLERGDQQLTESGDLVTGPRNTQSVSITAAKTENSQREGHISGPSFEEMDQGCKETSVFALRPEEDQNEQSVIHDSESQVIETDGTGDQPTGNGEKDIENSGTDPKTGLCAEGMAENELPESTETTQKAEVITSAQLRKAENASHSTETKETRDQLTSAKETHVAKDVSGETSSKKIETESTEKAENAKCLPLKSTGFEKRSGLPKLTNCEMSADDVQDGFQKQNVIPGNPDLDLENKENETVVFSTAVVIDSPGKDNSSTEDDQTVGILHERGKRENTQCDQHVAVHSQELVKDDKDRDTAQEITLHRLPVDIDVPPQILPTKQHDDEHFNVNRNNNRTNVSQERATVRQRVSGGACSQSTSKQDVAEATKLCSTCEGELSETASQGNTCRANDAGEESCNVPTGRTAKETEKGGEIPVDSKACEDQHQLTKNTNHSDTTDNPLPQTGVECGSVQLMNEEQEPAIKPQKMGFEINFSGLDSPDSSDVETALVLTDGRKSAERNSVTDHVFDSAFGNDRDLDRESHDSKIQEISDVEVGNSDKSDDDVPSDDINDSVVLEVPPQKYMRKYKERIDDLSVDSDKESWVSSSVVEEEEQQQGRSDAGSSRGDESDAESYVTSSSVDGGEPRWMASDSLEFDVMDTGEGGSGYRNDLDVIEEEGAEESEDSKDDEEMVSDAESGEDSEIGQMVDEEESGCLEQQSVTDKDVQICGSEEMSESAVCEVKDMKIDSEESRADPGSCQSEKSDVESEVKPESNHPFADQVNGGNDKVNENEIDDEKASDNSESTTYKAEERKGDQVVHEVTTDFELGEGEKAEGAHEKSMMSSTPHKEYSIDRETNQDAVTPSIERDNNFEAELRSKHTIVGKMILEAGEKEGSQTSSRSSTPLLDMPASQDSINHHDVSSIVSEEDLALILETQSDTEDSPAGKSQTSDGSSKKYESPAKRILMYGSHRLFQDGGQLSDEIREVLQNSDNQDVLSEKQGEEEEGKVVIPEVIDLVGKAVEEGQCTLDASFQDVAKESSHFQSLCKSKHENNVKHLDSTESFSKRLSTEMGSSETVQVGSDHGCAGDLEDDQQLEDHRQQMPGTSRSETCTIEATVPTEVVSEDQVPEVPVIGMANEKEEDKGDTVNDKTCEPSEAKEELKSDVYSSGDGPQKIDEESHENNHPEEMKSEAATLTTPANCEMRQQSAEALEADVQTDANDHEERMERSKEKVECKVDELRETLTEDGTLQGVTDNDKEGSNDGHGNDQSGLIHISSVDIKGQIVNERVINGEVGVESSMSSKMNEEPQIKSKDEVELGDDFSEHSHTENGEQQGANQDTHCINKDEISENIETGKSSTLSGSKGEKLQREDSIAHDSNKDGKCPELEKVKETGVADSIATPEVFEGQCGDRIAKTEDDEDVTIAPATEDHALDHNVCVQQKSIDDNLSSTILPVLKQTIKTKDQVGDYSKSVEDEPMETEMIKLIDVEENQTEKGVKEDETEMSEIAMDTNEDTSTRMANLQHTSDGVQEISAGGNTTEETTQMETETATGSQTSLLNDKERSNNSMRTDVSVDDIQKNVHSDCENFNGHEACLKQKLVLHEACLKFSKSKERIPQEKGKVKQVTQRGHDQGGKYCVQKLADVSQSYFVGYLVREFFKRLSHSPDLLNPFIVLHREEGIRRYVRDFFNEMNGTDQRAVIGSEVDTYTVKDSSGPSESVTDRIDDDVTMKNDKETASTNAAEERADSEMQMLGDDDSNIESVQRVETPESFVSCELSNERSTEVRAEVVETDIEMEQYYDCTEEIEESGMVGITQDDDKLEKNMIVFREVKSPYKAGLITSDEGRKDENSKHADIPDTVDQIL
ncbi:dentin sialophosphoprotein-like [Ptychodera flava]|uniref:dentin sialophosphoprotein-like n=1 Tax=Ptychodera flava TaxID=63121 RepID=UPI00396A3E27